MATKQVVFPRYPGRKPTGSPRSIDPAMRGAWLGFGKTNLVLGTVPIISSPGTVEGNGDLTTDGTAGESAQLDAATDARLWPRLKPFTWFMRMKFATVAVNGTDIRIFTNVNVGAATNYVVIYGKSNGTGWDIRANISGPAIIPSVFNVPAGKLFNLILTRDAAGVVTLYTDDYVRGTITAGADIYNRHTTNYHRLWLVAASEVSTTEAIYISHRYTPLGEVRALVRDPYKLFRQFQPALIADAAAGIVDLTAATFDFTAQDITIVEGAVPTVVDLTPAAFNWTANTIQNSTVINTTTAAFNYTANAISVLAAQVIDLSAAAFNYTAQSPQVQTVLSLTSAAVSWTANAIQLATDAVLTAATFNWSAKDIATPVSNVIDLTTASFNYTANQIQIATVITLSTASLTFTAKRVTIAVGGVVIAAGLAMLALVGVGR